MAAPTCMMDLNVHRAENRLTRVRMEVGRRLRQRQGHGNNHRTPHQALTKRPSLMEVSRGKVYGILQKGESSSGSGGWRGSRFEGGGSSAAVRDREAVQR